MSDDEYAEHLRKIEIESTETVGMLISFLKENFKPEDKVCYMDYVQGYKNDCTYVRKEDLGRKFFYRLQKSRKDPIFGKIIDEIVVV